MYTIQTTFLMSQKLSLYVRRLNAKNVSYRLLFIAPSKMYKKFLQLKSYQY